MLVFTRFFINFEHISQEKHKQNINLRKLFKVNKNIPEQGY